jgi:hypothetical protein
MTSSYANRQTTDAADTVPQGGADAPSILPSSFDFILLSIRQNTKITETHFGSSSTALSNGQLPTVLSYLFIVYLTTLSFARTTWRRMIGTMNVEL